MKNETSLSTATPIKFLPIPKRAISALTHVSINTLGELLKLSEKELLQVPNMGVGTIREIKDYLAQQGIEFGTLQSLQSLEDPTPQLEPEFDTPQINQVGLIDALLQEMRNQCRVTGQGDLLNHNELVTLCDRAAQLIIGELDNIKCVERKR